MNLVERRVGEGAEDEVGGRVDLLRAVLYHVRPQVSARATPEFTRGNRKSDIHEFTGKSTSKSIPTTSHKVNGFNS